MHPTRVAPMRLRLPPRIFTAYLFLALSGFLDSPLLARAAETHPVLDYGGLDQPALDALPKEQRVHVDIQMPDTEGTGAYAPEFSYLDRSLIGRQAPDVIQLSNSMKAEMDIDPGKTVNFVLPKPPPSTRRSEHVSAEALDAQGTDNMSGEIRQKKGTDAAQQENSQSSDANIDLIKRQNSQIIYISATTCRQPLPSNNGTTAPPDQPQLVMYVSTSSQNQKPGPESAPVSITFGSGYASYETPADGDVYIGISAPPLTNDLFGSWHFEVAASTDGYYHQYHGNDTFLSMIDTDGESALFITDDLSTSNDTDTVNQWKDQNPFKMYAFAAGDWTPIAGMENSYCAIKGQFNSTLNKNISITANITTKFLTKLPRSQFHVKGLDAGKTYNGYLVVEETDQTDGIPEIGKVGGGGVVFQPFNWTTKVDDSCQVLFDLDFCDSVAYAVPSSSKYKFNDTGLKELYDSQARMYYDNFQKSLAQVACEAVPESKYSLAQTCQDCERTYKDWLCSVLIPRCQDFTATDKWLQPRNIMVPFSNGSLPFDNNITKAFNETYRNRFAFNRSRNPMIDQQIQPGPYMELKPCQDLCYDIVRSCPAQLQFSCPNSPAMDLTYGTRDPSNATLQCNFPGALVKLNVVGAVGRLSVHAGSVALVALVVISLLWI